MRSVDSALTNDDCVTKPQTSGATPTLRSQPSQTTQQLREVKTVGIAVATVVVLLDELKQKEDHVSWCDAVVLHS